MPSATTFKGIYDIGDKSLTEKINDNLIMFLDWGFLNIGAYYNISTNSSGLYGGDKSQLKLVSDPRFDAGRVWESYAKNWVWESNLENNGNPIAISGVFLNGTFHSANTNHYYDYNNGRVIFTSPIPSNTIVKLNYSYKYINVNDGSNIPWVSRPTYDFSRIDSPTYNQVGSGDYSIISDRRIQMPNVSVEVQPIHNTSMYELGHASRFANNRVLFHILSDDKNTCKKIADTIVDQKDKIIFLFDVNKAADSGVFPLDSRGMLRSQALTYPVLVQEDKYLWNKLRFENITSQDVQRLNDKVYYSIVRATTEVVLLRV